MVYNFVTRKIFLEGDETNSSTPLQHYGAHWTTRTQRSIVPWVPSFTGKFSTFAD